MKMKLSRRQFLQRTTLAGAVLALPSSALAQTRPALPIPPLMDVGRGRPVRLDFLATKTAFNEGKLVEVWGVNGHYLAPTVRVRSGDFVKLACVNNLNQPLSFNIQGLQLSTEMIGSIHRPLAPNQQWSPVINVQQTACTGWYHANTMYRSALQVYRGIAGLWIVEDQASKKANLPNKYGVNDIPLILQDQQINREGVQVLDPNQPQFFGKQLFVNGKASPFVNVPRGWVRLRIVNASLSRPYDLCLDNDQPLHLIGTGVGMFAEPVEMPTIRLAPSQRVDVLVDLNEGKTVSLISGEKRDIFYKAKQFFDDSNALADNVVLELRPEGMAAVITEKPSLPPFELEQFNLNITQQRKFNLTPLNYSINAQRFDPKRIDFTAQKGTVERWYLTSDSDIGFTLQGAKFVIETRNRQRLPHKLLAWQDTVWLEKGQETTLLVQFNQTTSPEQPFTFGVTDLMLRDRGTMGQFVVVE
ncbi:cell division protein FtsQ [Haemophilus paracuniculus]|uniref:Cell division protein FtsQ n=2 Tax=Haemophilus paracuniculus TaxID=734 RepID=A0A1T0ARI0_9PAST|nr:cell division protein FtsQ [Haemophilus paracuniculus]